MGARRPKAVLIKPGEPGYIPPEVRLAQAAAEPSPAETQAAIARTTKLPSGIAYESLRVVGTIHKLRYSHQPNLVEAGDDQTITLYGEKIAPDGTRIPLIHYKVMPSGVEIYPHNVSSAIPAGAEVAEKLSRTGRMQARAEKLKAKMSARAEEKVEIDRNAIQEVPSEDDDVDESTEDDDETPPEGADDGIDV